MKRTNLLLALIVLLSGSVLAQYQEEINVEDFDRVQLDGNIRLYLEQSPEIELSIKAKKESYLDDYRIRVRNNVLYVQYMNDSFGSTSKLKIYLKHPELKGVKVDGLVHINSKDPIQGKEFALKGDGLIRGTVEVDVARLKVDLDGLCFMTFSGKADESVLRLDGLGRINAKDLETLEVSKRADGLAGIRFVSLK